MPGLAVWKMLAASGYVEPRDSDLIDLHVVCLNGEGCRLKRLKLGT